MDKKYSRKGSSSENQILLEKNLLQNNTEQEDEFQRKVKDEILKLF